MRNVMLFLTLLLVVLVALYRQRIYLRDPLATVFVGGIEDRNARAFINYSNDVLVESTAAPGGYRYLVQSWNHTAGTPATLTCLQRLACLADADHASLAAITDARTVTMSNREIQFADTNAVPVRVTLR